MRHRFNLIAALILIATPAARVCLADQPSAATQPSLESKLQRPLPSADLPGVELGDAVNMLHDVASINILVNWRELEPLKVDRKTAVRASVKDGTVAKLIAAVVTSANDKLGFDASHGAVYISTKEALKGPAARSTRVAGGETGAENAAARLRLKHAVPEVKFDSTKLSDALDYFHNKLGVPLEVDWTALRNAGVKADQPVTLMLQDVTTEDALYWVVRTLDQRLPVAYTLRNGKVVISTVPELEKGAAPPSP